ncbi:hypothetical protein [Thermocatellispora tengchongensis]
MLTSDGIPVLRRELRDEAIRVLVEACLSAHTRAKAANLEREGSAR